MRVRVHEGITGILELTTAVGGTERVIPDCDLDRTRALLLELEELRSDNGTALKDNYIVDGYDWFPTMVSELYWHVFYPYVRYTKLADGLLSRSVVPDFTNGGELANFARLMGIGPTDNWLKTRLFYALLSFNNWRVMRRHRADLLFLRFVVNDFRSVEMRRALDDMGISYIHVVPPEKRALLENVRRGDRYYFMGGPPARNQFNRRYDLSGLDPAKRRLFERAIALIESTISAYRLELRAHRRRLTRSGARVLYGFDDTNGYVHPVLYACRDVGIPTIGHQHGIYVRRHGGYAKPGIAAGRYTWFDRVIVWGRYWKEHLLRITDLHEPESIVVGCNRLPLEYRALRPQRREPRNVLIPYEPPTNTMRVGRYMVALMDLGYTVFFKPRPDETIEEQLASYGIPESHASRIRIAGKIDPEFMEQIDIVAGTMTVLLYELLPYNKIFWILETEFGFLDDMVEDGLAHKVRLEELSTLSARYFTPTRVEAEDFFNPTPLRDVVRRFVLEPVGLANQRGPAEARHAGTNHI